MSSKTTPAKELPLAKDLAEIRRHPAFAAISGWGEGDKPSLSSKDALDAIGLSHRTSAGGDSPPRHLVEAARQAGKQLEAAFGNVSVHCEALDEWMDVAVFLMAERVRRFAPIEFAEIAQNWSTVRASWSAKNGPDGRTYGSLPGLFAIQVRLAGSAEIYLGRHRIEAGQGTPDELNRAMKSLLEVSSHLTSYLEPYLALARRDKKGQVWALERGRCVSWGAPVEATWREVYSGGSWEFAEHFLGNSTVSELVRNNETPFSSPSLASELLLKVLRTSKGVSPTVWLNDNKDKVTAEEVLRDRTHEGGFVLRCAHTKECRFVPLEEVVELSRRVENITTEKALELALTLKSSVPGAEPVIAKNGKTAFRYANEVIKGPFPAGEAAIASQGVGCSMIYAIEVIKGRFLAAEASIAQDAEAAAQYAEEILQSRWPEAEAVIAKNVEASCHYAIAVLRGRFMAAEPLLAKDFFAAAHYEGAMKEVGVKLPSDWKEQTKAKAGEGESKGPSSAIPLPGTAAPSKKRKAGSHKH